MSSDAPTSSQVLKGAGDLYTEGLKGITSLYTENLGGAGQHFANSAESGGKALGIYSPPQTTIPQAPPAPPSLADTMTASLGQNLAHEQRLAAASTILTGGAGLMDEPTTASRVLLGS